MRCGILVTRAPALCLYFLLSATRISAQSVLQRFVAKLLHDVMKNSDKVDSLDLRFIIAHLLPPVLDYWTAFLECMPVAHQPPHADLYPMEMEIDADVVYMQYILVSVD